MKIATTVIVAVMLSAAIATFTGCDIGDVIQTRTPESIQRTTGLSASLPLNEASDEFEVWLDQTRVSATRWRANIERSDRIADMVGQFALTSLDDIGPSLAGVPVLGPALPLLAGLAGLFTRRPGDMQKRDAETAAQAKADAAWDEATAKAKDLLTAGRA